MATAESRPARSTPDGIFAVTAWIRLVGDYALSCFVWRIGSSWVVWVEENGHEVRRTTVGGLVQAMSVADEWFGAYQHRFYTELDTRRH